MKTNYSVTNGGLESDFGDLFVPRNLFSSGGLWGWGQNNFGHLGDNTSTNKSSPVQTISGGANWTVVEGGRSSTAAIKTDGTLWNWGRNNYGQLGDNTVTTRSSPVQTIAVGTNWKLVSAGLYYSAAIKTDGTLWTWGFNANGRLGTSDTTNRSSPVQTIASGTNWKTLSCGSNHMAAIKTDGTLWLWGYGFDGQLGQNVAQSVSSPIQTIAAGTNWSQVNCGSTNTAAIKTDGTLWVWGGNAYGQLGNQGSTAINQSSPVQTISAGTNWKVVACGYNHMQAIKTDGTLWTWGGNTYGQLGTNNTLSKSSPVQTVSGGTNWKLVSSGFYYTAATKTDGTLWTWGYNNYGQLGTDDTINRSTPGQTIIADGTYWRLVVASNYHAVGITDIF
jgi:alpha-tubulin suppressor-like RCC1 family protein